MRRLGLFGGTFDPVHFGHLGPARIAFDALELDALVLIPGARPPHKLQEPLTPFAHRFAMLVLATREHERWFVSDIEQGRQGPSYTIDTLTAMARTMPAEETFFLMGSDSFAQLTTWHRWAELVEMAHLVVLHRAGAWGAELTRAVPEWLGSRVVTLGPGQRAGSLTPGKKVLVLEHDPWPLSATELRAALGRGASAHGAMPVEVERYALKYHLYGRGDAHEHGC